MSELPPVTLKRLKATTNQFGVNNAAILSIGPSSIEEMSDLADLASPDSTIVGIELSLARTEDISRQISSQPDSRRHKVIAHDGWELSSGLPQDVKDSPIPAIVAFNSLGIAIHDKQLRDKQRINIINKFLDQIKDILRENGLLIVRVGTACLELTIKDEKYEYVSDRCIEAEYLRSMPAPYISELRRTNVWEIWIKALK